jgi:Cu2+-exporting ATPase
MPVDKREGDPLVAGSVNLGAPVLARVLRVGGDTRLAAIVSMMKSALDQRPAAARLADRWAPPFLWTVLLLAAAAAAAWSVIDPPRALWVAVSVLIVTCPCALSLAAPATLVAAARGLAGRGVLLQRLDAIEALTGVQRIFLDKTGTLTEDRLQLRAARLLPAATAAGLDEATALAQAASLAGWSTHPLSAALAAAVPGAAAAWSGVQELPGQGLQALDAQGRSWRLGTPHWVAPASAAAADAAADAAVWLGVEGRAVAAFEFDEVLRVGTAEAVQALQAQGLALTLLSGDSPQRARRLAARVGIDDVVARATPEAKLEAVAAAQARGERVAMVGDGINDAPVLARADVSLAMGQGALVARSGADAVLMRNRLADLVDARHTAMRAVRIVRQNFFWAAAYNASAIPMALAGWLPPWAAGLGMALSSLLVIGNALRAARAPSSHAGRPSVPAH